MEPEHLEEIDTLAIQVTKANDEKTNEFYLACRTRDLVESYKDLLGICNAQRIKLGGLRSEFNRQQAEIKRLRHENETMKQFQRDSHASAAKAFGVKPPFERPGFFSKDKSQ